MELGPSDFCVNIVGTTSTLAATMSTVGEIFAIFICIIVQSQCQENISCGKMNYSSETIVKGSEKIIPWTAFVVDKTDPKNVTTFAGILVSPNLVFLSAHYFYNDKSQQLQISRSGSQYEVIVGSYEFSNETTQGQRISVSLISIHPKFSRTSQWTDTNYDFALAHLSSPVNISESVQPICIPSFDDKKEMEDSIEPKPLFVFGWPKNHTYLYKGFQLETLDRRHCTNLWKKRLTPGHRDNIYCAVVSQANDEAYCANRDIGSFYFSNGSYYFSGQVLQLFSNKSRCTKGSEFLIWSLTNDTLQWIRNSDKCGENKFTCFKEGNCIERTKLCDGMVDCMDASDEQTQYCTNPKSCGVGELRCRVYGACVPSAKIGDGKADCPNQEDEEKLNKTYDSLKLSLGIGIGILIIVIAIIGYLYFHFKVQKLKKHIRDLTEDEVNEFFLGGALYGTVNNYLENADKEEECYFPIYLNGSIIQKPWDDVFEISPLNLEIGDELGRGEFGIVYKANLRRELPTDSSLGTIEVAVKTQLPNMGIEEFKNLLREVKITAHVGSHECIVGLIGACTQSIKKRKVCLVIEYCANGNLLHLLQTLDKDVFAKLSISEERVISYTNAKLEIKIVYSDFFKWASQIASGMAHLGQKNVIHGDLAARNILLTENFNAKICDFGLSRELTDTNIYVKTTNQPIPWKWLALESFTTHTFSYSTDVWAYGVTLWEIFSLGESPYGDIPCNANFIIGLQNGNRLPAPKFASAPVYEILLSTWNDDPQQRPTFDYLELFFLKLHESSLQRFESDVVNI